MSSFRATWLWAVHRVKMFFSRCDFCGAFNPESVSLFYPKKACRVCAMREAAKMGL